MKNKEQMRFHMCHHQTLDYKLDSVLQRFALTAYISFFFFFYRQLPSQRSTCFKKTKIYKSALTG